MADDIEERSEKRKLFLKACIYSYLIIVIVVIISFLFSPESNGLDPTLLLTAFILPFMLPLALLIAGIFLKRIALILLLIYFGMVFAIYKFQLKNRLHSLILMTTLLVLINLAGALFVFLVLFQMMVPTESIFS